MIDDEVALLWLARETGVLEALLSSAATPEEAAAEAGVPDRAGRILARGLADRGFFERVDGGYEPSNRALGFLTRTDPRSIGSVPHRADLLERLTALPEGLDRDGEGTPTDPPAHWTENRLGAVEATEEATVRAAVTAAVREAPDAERVLDVGGAPGTFAREFVRRGRDVTLCVSPEAAGPTRRLLAPEPVEVVERDLPPTSLPEVDLAFVPELTHRLTPGENRGLLATVADALSPGGTAVAVDALRDRSPAATDVALDALASTAGGDTYPTECYREWFREAGFSTVTVRQVPGTDRQAVVGSRP
jgi:SAM-dependent methyltransferase